MDIAEWMCYSLLPPPPNYLKVLIFNSMGGKDCIKLYFSVIKKKLNKVGFSLFLYEWQVKFPSNFCVSWKCIFKKEERREGPMDR